MAGVRASVSKNAVRGCERTAMMREWKMELQRRTEFLTRPHPYPLPQGEGTALARLLDHPHVSLAAADCWLSFHERLRFPQRQPTTFPTLCRDGRGEGERFQKRSPRVRANGHDARMENGIAKENRVFDSPSPLPSPPRRGKSIRAFAGPSSRLSRRRRLLAFLSRTPPIPSETADDLPDALPRWPG